MYGVVWDSVSRARLSPVVELFGEEPALPLGSAQCPTQLPRKAAPPRLMGPSSSPPAREDLEVW